MGNSRVQKFTISGNHQAQLVLKDPMKGGHLQPDSIAVDANDVVYVSVLFRNRIWMFTSNGKFIKCLGEGDQERPILRSPSGLALDGNGKLYVCNQGSGQLIVL